MTNATLEITQQAGSLGAFALGVDLRQPPSDAIFETLHAAFLEHHVLVIRDQDITPAEQLAFAARFGTIFIHPYVPSIDGYPGIMQVTDPHPITVTWHSDTTHSKTPPMMSLLLARELPAVGGDTMFANQHIALENLTHAMQRMLSDLRAVHRGTELAAEAGVEPLAVEAIHPVVRTHPETGRKALFVNGNYTSHFEGMTKAESVPLLAFLYAQASRPEYTFRHRWRAGDLLLWDNRSVQHCVVPDVGKGERCLHRVTIEGDVPV
jgi:taurine dioxygenase